MATDKEIEILSQADLDELFSINEFIGKQDKHSLVSELKMAILDSGKLELEQWRLLRVQLREIEELIPHIDLIIKLKKDK